MRIPHLEAGHLRIALDELERSDWIPFRSLMGDGTFTMLSHARLTALDPERPVSFSHAVVADLLREAWRHDGVLITDDFSMGAAYASKEGIAVRCSPAPVASRRPRWRAANAGWRGWSSATSRLNSLRLFCHAATEFRRRPGAREPRNRRKVG
jgi:hypothetical protein